MPSEALLGLLNEQVGHEFAASQQYVACAVHYDARTLPQLARYFYAQALEEREHAMMMVQFLMDVGEEAVIPGVVAPQSTFADDVAPIALALAQEKTVTDQINRLAAQARQDGDYTSEQFLQWFIKEQVEEVASMNDLLTVAERTRGDVEDLESYVARELADDGDEDPTAPHAAGAA